MPIYEFECPNCQHRFSVLARRVTSDAPPCPECGHVETTRLISRVQVHQTESSVQASSGKPGSPGYYNDPRNIGRTTEQRFKKMGVELPGSVKEQIQAARQGELPPSLKKELS
jgi:putative FmdB family regulatory protein